MDFEKIQEMSALNILYDYYGELLPEKQREMFRMYYEDNYSLAEIGQELGISRQGVHEAIKRAGEKLEDYENKLGLAGKIQAMEETLRQAEETLEQIYSGVLSENMDPEEFQGALKRMKEELSVASDRLRLI